MEQNMMLIAQRIKGLREIMEVSSEEMAVLLNIDVAEYEKYEAGTMDFSFSFLYTVAERLGVGITDLLTGESAKLSMFTLVRKDDGLAMKRRSEYQYEHLAYLFKNKAMEPFMVTVEPSDVNAATHKKTHSGQEFNFILEGSMTLFIGAESVYLEQGDAIYFNPNYPHAMQAEQGRPCRFLAIIAKGE